MSTEGETDALFLSLPFANRPRTDLVCKRILQNDEVKNAIEAVIGKFLPALLGINVN